MTQRSLWAGRSVALLGILLVALSLRILTGCAAPIYGLIGESFNLPLIAISVLGALAPAGFALASFITLEWDGIVGLYNSGFDPQRASLSPGVVLLTHLGRLRKGAP